MTPKKLQKLILIFFVLFSFSFVFCSQEPSSVLSSDEVAIRTGSTSDFHIPQADNVVYSDYDKTTSGFSYNSESTPGSYNFDIDVDITTDNPTIKEQNGTPAPISDTQSAYCSGSLYVYKTAEQIIFSYNPDISDTKNYRIKIHGTSSRGLYIENTPSVSHIELVLQGADISTQSVSPIASSAESTVHLVLDDKSTNVLQDGRNYGTAYTFNDNGAIAVNGNLYIRGNGALLVSTNYKNGIYSKGYTRVVSNDAGDVTRPYLEINSSGENGICATNGFVFDAGMLQINATGEHTNYESKGIYVHPEAESNSKNNAGFVIIKSGKIKITSISKGIEAGYSLQSTSETSTPKPFVLVAGGDIAIKTLGAPYENYKTTVKKAGGASEELLASLRPTGIEANRQIYILGGRIDISSTDSSFLTREFGEDKSDIIIENGYINAQSHNNSCFYSGGDIVINGGVVVASATNELSCSFGCASESYNFVITGGNVLGVGSKNYSRPSRNLCNKQGVMILSSKDFPSLSGEILTISTSQSKIVYACQLPLAKAQGFVVLLSNSALESSNLPYSVRLSDKVTSGLLYNGLYTSLPEYQSTDSGTILWNRFTFQPSAFVLIQQGASNEPIKAQVLPNKPSISNLGGK